MSSECRRFRLAVLTEIIAPYRIPVFNYLAQDPRIDLEVLFFAETEERRAWRVPKEKIRFRYHVLRGMILGRAYQRGSLFLNPGIVPRLLRGKFDCIIVGGYHHPTIWLAMAYARMRGTRLLIWSESTLRDHRPGYSLREHFKRLLVSSAKGYLAAGQSHIEYLIHLGAPKDRIWMAPNAVDTHFFSRISDAGASQGASLRARLGVHGAMVLYVGRLLDEKGIPDLLAAFERLVAAGNDATLVLVGDGPDRQKYAEAMARSRCKVVFTGFIDQDSLPPYYAAADIFAFPTRSDPWGLALNEAMASGLPVVCSSAAGAARDLVRDGENGFVHEPGDIERLEHQLRCLVCDRELRMRMGKRSRVIIGGYSPELMARGFLEAALDQSPGLQMEHDQ